MSKYCINCKHFSPEENDHDHRFARCAYNQPINLVTGQKDRVSMDFCSVARMDGPNKCGVAAAHFEEASHV